MLTKLQLIQIRQDIDTALAAIAAKHGLSTLKTVGCTYLDDTFTMKVDGLLAGGLSKEALAYQYYQPMMNLPVLGTIFVCKNRKFKTTGLNKTRTKVFAAEVATGKEFQFSTPDFIKLTGSAKKAAPSMPLNEFAAAVNALSKDECATLNADKKKLFAAEHIDLPESMLAIYHRDGLTPQEAYQSICAEAEAERRFEARAS